MFIWLSSIVDTIILCILVSLFACMVGLITAVLSWLSNQYYTFFVPILLLSVPPWLLAFYLNENFLLMNPWVGAVLSLGLTSAVYPHSFIVSALHNRGHGDYELVKVLMGNNLKSLLYACMPSIKIAMLPSIAVVSAEVVSDFGVVNYFGIKTLTMLTYSIWTSTWQFNLLIPGLVLLGSLGWFLTKVNLKPNQYLSINCDQTNKKSPLAGVISMLPVAGLLLYIILQSLLWILDKNTVYEFKISALKDSAILVFTVSFICVITILFYMFFDKLKTYMKKTGIFFYALPGTVIGAAYMFAGASYIPLLVLLIIAISTRYFGLIVHSTAAADDCNQKNYEVVETLVDKKLDKVFIKLKILLPSVSLGLCLIILDVLRELPISLILNPMNFSTLAMRMNYIATTEYTPGLALYSLTLIGFGIIISSVVIWIMHVKNKKFTI